MKFTNLFADSDITRPTFAERIKKTKKLIANTNHIIIGAGSGSGLSTAAGISYDADDFHRVFKPWIEKYGITDLYSSSFYPFKTEEERWAYWARHVWFCRYRVGATTLYKELLNIVKDKDYFVITTNVDGQFLKAGFEPNRLFYTQGDYCYFQDSTGDDRNLYYNETKVRQMLANTANDLHIPTSMIPLDPVNGHGMAVNLRCDNTFVEDDNWHAMCSRYENFVRKQSTSYAGQSTAVRLFQ